MILEKRCFFKFSYRKFLYCNYQTPENLTSGARKNDIKFYLFLICKSQRTKMKLLFWNCDHVPRRSCPPNYKPPPSCLLKRCPVGSECCYDGCSLKCYYYLQKPIDERLEK
ncbi:hypothetical protein Anas_12963 [Armadillidium nasatum]|uniref:Uncharacterized protein n=1 Tax=Armadillidium nasatum TaxID=96803 RepID=A0A5N5TEI6_9CRUS|nr:hypothetical protein Anas_12963 [Armadillidium nasatum]